MRLPADFLCPSSGGPACRALLRGVLLSASLWALLSVPAQAVDYRDDIGYPALTAELGSSTPLGTGVAVSQTEASAQIGTEVYLPDLTNAEFAGKSIVDGSGTNPPGLNSTHATAVAKIFYGDVSSIARGVPSIVVYDANTWLFADFLQAQAGTGTQPSSSSARVANDSWVGTTSTSNATILRRLDWVIARDDFITAVALQNGGANEALLASSFNAIAVGRSDNGHASGGTAAVDSVYTAGRVRPDIVAPETVTSLTTPIVAAAAAVLVEVGHANAALSTDPVSQSTTNRALAVIRNAERSEVVKAALMAGALRSTRNVYAANIANYRVAAVDQASNGLDLRYGAGQVNIANSYHIIAAGEKNSLQDYSAGGGLAGIQGFDYDPKFGGKPGANDVGTYYFPVQAVDSVFSFALVWNVSIGSVSTFGTTAVLYNLDAFLYDVSNAASPVLVASSESTTENTENLHVTLTAGHAYSVQVKRPATQAIFSWDYGAAWQIVPLDTDFDGIPDSLDNCPLTANPNQADADGDGIGDVCDNCTLVPNTNQLDADGDGYGNLCDADLNNSGLVTSADAGILSAVIGQLATASPTAAAADLNGSGRVTTADYAILRSYLGVAPGPSGLHP